MFFAEVGLGDLLWTAIWVFFLVNFVWVFIVIVGDLFRDAELSGGAKALWLIALVMFPVVGSLAYLVVRGQGMALRGSASELAVRERAAPDGAGRDGAARMASGPIDDLVRLEALRTNGTIDDDEFRTIKARLVGGTARTA